MNKILNNNSFINQIRKCKVKKGKVKEMNNLLFFRNTAGIKPKLLAKLLNVTVHTYLGFEQEKMCIPDEIQIMLSIIYDIDKIDLFSHQSFLSSETIETIKKLSQLEEYEVMDIVKNRLFGNVGVDINYRTVKKIKKEIKNNSCE
jgi:hypothetical protein